MSTVTIKDVSMQYKQTQALQNVSLTFDRQGIYGLLGRNGAGKTTLINIVSNRIVTHSGTVEVDGEIATENDRAQGKIFCMTEKSVYPDMRAAAGIKWLKMFYPAADTAFAEALAARFALDLKKRIRALSTGYSTIYKAILTLASNAEVMILDEPTLGLDANHRELLYRVILEYYAENPRTIILSTHMIDEVAPLLEHVVILNKGRLIADKSVDEILESAHSVAGAAEVVDKYAAGKRILKSDSVGSFKTVTVYSGLSVRERKEIEGMGLEVVKPGLQELFVALTSGEGEDNA